MGMFTDLAGVAADLINNKNQQDTQKYEKWAQQMTWNREDTAVQRRAADLRAAGLSQTLAAGGAAQTSTPTKISTPELKGDNLMKALEYTQAKKQNAQTDAQTELLKQNADNAFNQSEKTKREIAILDTTAPFTIARAKAEERMAQENLDILQRENNWYKERGLPNSLTGIAESYATGDQIAKMFGGDTSNMSPALNALTRLAGQIIPGLIPSRGKTNTTNHYLKGVAK